jgi:hypothetical protein
MVERSSYDIRRRYPSAQSHEYFYQTGALAERAADVYEAKTLNASFCAAGKPIDAKPGLADPPGALTILTRLEIGAKNRWSSPVRV